MDRSRIEDTAHEVHCELWRQKDSLWPIHKPHPIEMLHPVYAAKVLGVELEWWDELGRFGHKGTQFEVAGLIDRHKNKIAISQRFPSKTIRFTAAHELGHWLLHKNEVMHRDWPIDGLSPSQSTLPLEEREANHFAACYLMPRKLVTNVFEHTFKLTAPLKIDDITAFLLRPNNPESLLEAEQGPLTCALAVASCTSFNGKHMQSLATLFHVSPTSMAIRLKELELIQE